MNKTGHRLLLTMIFAVAISTVSSYAQPKSAGLVSSFKGFALSYEHWLRKEGMFVEMALSADASEMLLYRSDYPGISASLTCNHTFISKTLQDGTEMSVFAGPGVTCGYGRDFKSDNGYFFGMKGRAGVEWNFDRRVVISICISPLLGMHIISHDEYLALRYYKNGLFYSLIPEIGIKYRFGK